MVYKHRTKSGKVKHYQSKGHYEKSLKGMFANNYQKKNHSKKIAKAKAKRQMKHRGIGKVSSGKTLCATCRGKGLSLTEGRCKVCAKEFASFKQPEPPKKTQMEIVEEKINDNWVVYVDSEWDTIRRELDTITPNTDIHEALMYMLININKNDMEIDSFRVINPVNWEGDDLENYWVADIEVDHHTTKQDLQDRNIGESSFYWLDFQDDEELGTVDGGFVV